MAGHIEPLAPERLRARSFAFVRVNGTGIGPFDRPVSFGAVKLTLEPPGEIAVLHLVFDPESAYDPEAARRHGYSERELRAQESFDAYARPLARWLGGANLVIAEGAVELRLLREAVARGGGALTAPERTLRSFRFFGEAPPSLDAMASRLNALRPVRHGAMGDAWLCMQAFLWVHGLPWRFDVALAGDPTPQNWRAPPRSALETLFRRRA